MQRKHSNFKQQSTDLMETAQDATFEVQNQ